MKIDKKTIHAIISEEVAKVRRAMILKEEERIIRRKLSALDETGEWSNDEDDVAWKEALKQSLQDVESMLNPGVHFEILDIKGFDKYQGPYAIIGIHNADAGALGKEPVEILNKYKVWTTEHQGELWIENFPIDNTSKEGKLPGFQGSVVDIADVINKKYSIMARHLNEKEVDTPADNKYQEVRDEIEMRLRPEDQSLANDEINDIANENGVNFEYVLDVMSQYVIDRDKQREKDLRYDIEDVIKTDFGGNNSVFWGQFWRVFNAKNFENNYGPEETKKVFDVLTKDPNQLSMFEGKKN
jgi:hypothetical protein